MTSIILPGMVKRRRGLIVNMSSQSGEIPVPMMSVYASTKVYVYLYFNIFCILKINDIIKTLQMKMCLKFK